jgi:hypothetical protein
MHADRSAETLGGASCQRSAPPRPVCLPHAADPRVMKVVGLGAPVSVRIRFDACEADLIADELREQISVYETTEAEARAGVIGEQPDDEARRDLLWEFRRMLALVERDAGVPSEPFEVVWPTVLAYQVLRGVLGHAAERLQETLQDPNSTDAIRDALRVVGALLDTWEAFRVIDNGGLQDVAL